MTPNPIAPGGPKTGCWAHTVGCGVCRFKNKFLSSIIINPLGKDTVSFPLITTSDDLISSGFVGGAIASCNPQV